MDNQNLFETIENLWDKRASKEELQQIVRAVDRDKVSPGMDKAFKFLGFLMRLCALPFFAPFYLLGGMFRFLFTGGTMLFMSKESNRKMTSIMYKDMEREIINEYKQKNNMP